MITRERLMQGVVPKTGRAIALAFVIALMFSDLVSAAGLSDADYHYLKKGFGLGRDSFALANSSPGDAARLHELINDPRAREYPGLRDLNVADFLLDVQMRTCQAWQLAHGGRKCPQVTDERLIPGWEVAERNCIACHLTGTTDAPSFFRLAQSAAVDEDRLAVALRSGHAMSPITLGPQELHELAQYINSLR